MSIEADPGSFSASIANVPAADNDELVDVDKPRGNNMNLDVVEANVSVHDLPEFCAKVRVQDLPEF